MFSSKEVNIQPGDKLKEGWLSKESRYRKVWRKRWCVLTSQHLYTLKKMVCINITTSLYIRK